MAKKKLSKRAFRYCRSCKTKLQKNGHAANGKQLWKCSACHSNRIHVRPDLARKFVFHSFLQWLLGKQSQSDLFGSQRTFRDQIAWCWNIPVPAVLTGEIYSVIILDGIHVGGLVCLIARTKKHVVAWLWVDRENSQNWTRLLLLLPAPVYAICDGQRGVLKALTICWSGTKVQRCHFHVQANIRSKLTLHPQTKPAQDLARLMRFLHFVRSKKQRTAWIASFRRLGTEHASHLAEKTRAHNPQTAGRKWWYTHSRDRSAFRQIERLITDSSLFCYCSNPSLIPNTTNILEGGTNSLIRRQLGYHRGLPKAHQQVLTNWLLYSQSENAKSSFFRL